MGTKDCWKEGVGVCLGYRVPSKDRVDFRPQSPPYPSAQNVSILPTKLGTIYMRASRNFLLHEDSI